jgi:hypothetical protein
MMTKDEYLQYQKQFLKEEQEAAKVRANKEEVAKKEKIRRDKIIYGRECYGFRCLSPEQQTDFILARLDYGKIRQVIQFATDTKARMVLLGDFHDTASMFALHPEVIAFVKTMTTANGPQDVEVTPTEAMTPMPGPLARATYSRDWIREELNKTFVTGTSKQIPDPLCLYESSRLYDQLTKDQRDKHVGTIHLNFTREVYLGVPTTAPNIVNQLNEVHSVAVKIPPLRHPENYAVYFEEYNRERILSHFSKICPIKNQTDAKRALKVALKQAHDERALTTILPDRGSSLKIQERLEEAINTHVHNVAWLYQELFMQAVTLEVATFIAEYPGTVWASGICLAQDPEELYPYKTTLLRYHEPRKSHSTMTSNSNNSSTIFSNPNVKYYATKRLCMSSH